MSLIAEDGSNVAGAESYETVAGADLYHSNRGNAAWAALSTTAKEQSLRKATDYMAQAYRKRWRGYRSYATQALDWPRQQIVIDDSVLNSWIDYTTIPTEIKAACSELALKASSAELAPDIERETASEAIGSISVSYFQGSKQNTTYRAVDLMLKHLLINDGNGMQIVRS